ncbi:50S ribosomal protein L24 [Nanoarchaeota archaeon NZ13-N]|uniref:Large ribosomal subunit protein uL24 n=1 Tax=Candidatus Nanoclepta minutus TaxID=1940235 RepID=A0A397WMU3_9ARCH|nr:MAG: 50S ribosomal protein L24 [Nanoarchaeota archaeon NZ13-N]RIB35221.1 MAG: 50S ribosomal protein L24 [Candidatus Nanoclepta minutus]
MVLEFKNIKYDNWYKGWKKSKQPRKQRKYLINAPIHIRRKIMCSTLSEEIRKILRIKSFPIRVGDYVRILRGKFRGTEGLVVKVDAKRYRVFVENAKYNSKTGKEIYYPIHHSKLMILKLNLTDKLRIEALIRKVKDRERVDEIIKKFSVGQEDVKKAIDIGRNI